MAHASRAVTLLVVTLLAAGGCAEFEPGSDTLTVNGAALQPPASSPDWACLDDGELEPAPEPVFSESAERVVVSLQIVDLSTGLTYPDAALRACGISDINCESPVADGLHVDARGWVDVPLFAGFKGFVEITSPTMAPVIFYYVDPLPAGSRIEYPVTVVSRAGVGPLVQLLGVAPDPDAAIVALRAFNCSGDPAAGVTFTMESDGVPWYLAGRLPNAMVDATDAEGIGGWVNVQPGLAVVDVRAPDGRSIATPRNLVARPGWMSYNFARPRGILPP